VIDSSTMRSRSDFWRVFTPETRQNHEGEPGSYSYYLQRGWSAGGTVTVQVAVSDTAGNGTVVAVRIGREV